MMFVSFCNTTTGGHSGTGTAYPHRATMSKPPFFNGVLDPLLFNL